MINEAIILCGGLGTRLREETEFRPKPMVEIGDKPMLWHIMRRYSEYGVKRFILCLGYKGDVIRDYFLHYHYYMADFSVKLATGDVKMEDKSIADDWEVVLAETGDHSQTGSRIARAMRHVKGDTFFATYGDGVADIDIDALYQHHCASKKIATLTAVLPPSRYGEITTKNGVVEFFAEKPQVTAGAINGGFFVFDKKRLKPYMPKNPLKEIDVTLEAHILNKLAEDGQLAAYEHQGFWQCMDTYRETQLLNHLCKQGKAPWLMKDGKLLSGVGGVSSSQGIPDLSAAG